MMNRFSSLSLILLMAVAITACVEDINPNITPVANLSFYVTDGTNPVQGAVVYLFPFQTTYNTYLADNPEGNDQITPPISSDNVAVTDVNGLATFRNKALDGNSFASGTTWFHRPNPIYFRVEATRSGPVYLTNDDDVFKISFGELESGDVVNEEVDVLIK
ncbi:MAG: hypothetical protein NWR72_00840 [Bacteroidia bacterium]|nr:hypothetical protein [Bacteroidia bacterium]